MVGILSGISIGLKESPPLLLPHFGANFSQNAPKDPINILTPISHSSQQQVTQFELEFKSPLRSAKNVVLVVAFKWHKQCEVESSGLH